MDDFLRYGTAFDWVTPLLGALQSLRHGRSVGFRVPANTGNNAAYIRRLLAAYGIASWGHLWVGDSLLFHVRLRQARFAEHVLSRAGVPYTCGKYTHRRR